MSYLVILLFFGIPVASIVFFIVSLCQYLSARNQEKQEPGSVDTGTMLIRKRTMIVSAVIAGVLTAVDIAFITLMCMAIAFM